MLDHRLVAGLVLLGVLLAALLGVLRLRIDFSSTSFYGDEGDAAAQLAEHQARWGPDDSTLLVLVEPSVPDDPAGVLSSERLAAIEALGEALANAPGVVRVESLASLTLLRPGANGEPQPVRFVSVAAFWGLAGLAPEERVAYTTRLPIVPGMLSAEGESTVLVAELEASSDDVLANRKRVAAIEAALADEDPALAEVGLQRRLAGVPAIRAGFVELVFHDQLRFVPLTLVLIGLSLGLCFRSIQGVAIPAIAAGVPIAILVGVMAWSGEAIGLLNQVYFTLLPLIAVADAVHMLARYHEARAKLGDQPGAQRQAIVTAGSRVGVACLLTTVTTGAGFASLGVSQMPILRSFGFYAALGVCLAFVTVVVIVPLLLSFVPDEPNPRPLLGWSFVDRALDLALRRPWACLIAGLAMCVLALIPARGVVIDNHLSDLLDPEHPTSEASAHIDAAHGGVLGLEFELIVDPALGVDDPALLEAVAGFEDWLRAQPEVREVRGLASLVAMSGELWDEPLEIPGDVAGVQLRIESLAEHAPLDRFVRADEGRLRIHAGVPDVGGQAFVALADRAEAELGARLAEFDQVQVVPPTSTALLAYRGVNGITGDLRRSFTLVFAVVTVVIVALFRSGWPALVALVPNAGPLILGYASLGVLGIVLDPLAAVILTLGLGIAVDDSVHVMVRTREELAAGRPIEEALRRGVGHSGRAVAVTTAVLVAGLGLNYFASFPALVLLGLLGAVVLGLALVFDLLVLPASIVLLRGRGLK